MRSTFLHTLQPNPTILSQKIPFCSVVTNVRYRWQHLILTSNMITNKKIVPEAEIRPKQRKQSQVSKLFFWLHCSIVFAWIYWSMINKLYKFAFKNCVSFHKKQCNQMHHMTHCQHFPLLGCHGWRFSRCQYLER